MNVSPRLVLRFVGTIALLCAVLGIYFNWTTFSAVFAGERDIADGPFFYPAFLIMSRICLGCHALLIVLGFPLLLGRATTGRALIAVLIFEIAFQILIGVLWHLPFLGESIAEATGISMGGLAYQFMILFPLWAPYCILWALRRLEMQVQPVMT